MCVTLHGERRIIIILNVKSHVRATFRLCTCRVGRDSEGSRTSKDRKKKYFKTESSITIP